MPAGILPVWLLNWLKKGVNEMNLKEYTNFHFIGIGGMGMRALAEILLEKGYSVSGSDMADSPVLENFRKGELPSLSVMMHPM